MCILTYICLCMYIYMRSMFNIYIKNLQKEFKPPDTEQKCKR